MFVYNWSIQIIIIHDNCSRRADVTYFKNYAHIHTFFSNFTNILTAQLPVDFPAEILAVLRADFE